MKPKNLLGFGTASVTWDRQKLLLVAMSVLLLVGCATTDRKTQMRKEGRTCVEIKSDEVLYSSVVSQGAINGVASRIKKHLTKTLDEAGIKSGAMDTYAQGDSKLTIELSTLETETKHKPGPFFSTIVYQHVVIRYSATLVSGDGTKLFEFDGHEHDESLDKLTKIVGEYIGKRVAKCYR